MFIKDGIAYSDNEKKSITVISVRALEDYKLWVRFSTGEVKIVDFKSLIKNDAFSALQDKSVFDDVYVDFGVSVWKDGEIDIAPEYLYHNGTPYHVKENIVSMNVSAWLKMSKQI